VPRGFKKWAADREELMPRTLLAVAPTASKSPPRHEDSKALAAIPIFWERRRVELAPAGKKKEQ